MSILYFTVCTAKYVIFALDKYFSHLQIDAHVGGVNDLAFSHPNKQLCVITCGDDKTIKVGWSITCLVF